LVREFLPEKYEIVRLSAVVMLGHGLREGDVQQGLAASKSPTERFMAEWVAENERVRRTLPGGIPHVAKMSSLNQQTQHEEAKRKLRVHALEAWLECQRMLKEVQRPNEILVLEIIRTIMPSLEPEQPQIVEAVQAWAAGKDWLEDSEYLKQWVADHQPRKK
jgi:hypothetical protein